MNKLITKHPESKQIIKDFIENKKEIYTLAPGYSTNIENGFRSETKDREYGYLNSSEIKKDLKKYFGSFDGQIEAKGGVSKILVYSYKNETLMSLSGRSEIGTGWYWITKNEGSRYWMPVLLCNSVLVSHFWPDFCNDLLHD